MTDCWTWCFGRSLNGPSCHCSFISSNWFWRFRLGLIVPGFCSICQTLMVLLEVGQTSASFQALFGRSAFSHPYNSLVFGRHRENSAACSYRSHSRVGQCGRNTRRASVISSALTSDLLSVGFFSAATAGLLYSATPLFTGKAKQANQGKSDGYGETDAEPEGIKWGVMSVVSFIPLVNWTVSCNARPAGLVYS